MKTYTVTIQPQSPFITPLQSDTIFGHLAWAIAYEQGEKRLKQVLDGFNSGKPPFLLSAAFPEDMLPIPILPSLTQGEVNELVRWVVEHKDRLPDKPDNLREELEEILRCSGNGSVTTKRWLIEEIKKTKRAEYISIDDFKNLASALSSLKLTESLLTYPQPKLSEKQVVMRTAIDRLTGSAKEGRLFDLEETFYGSKGQDEFHPVRLSIWLKLSDDLWKPEIYRWFKIVEGSGFGKRKSIGLGQFQIVSDIVEAELPSVANPNAFITLSSYVPKTNEPTQGCYRYIVKRGKLGGPWALGGKVWKTPLLMFTPGSLFYTNGKLADHYGSLVPVLDHEQTHVFQYAYAFPLGVRLSQVGEP